MRSRLLTPQRLAPLVAFAALAGLAIETYSRPSPADAEPFHQRVRQAAEALPIIIGDWQGVDLPADPAAISLLKPNVIYRRRFHNPNTQRSVSVLIVHCKDARDLYGHYPPACYPRNGMLQRKAKPMDCNVAGQEISGMQYMFASSMFGGGKLVVDNFILLPGGGIERDMQGVRQRTGDYTMRHFGAAQLQVVYNEPNISDREKQEIFNTMIRAHMPLIEAITEGVDP